MRTFFLDMKALFMGNAPDWYKAFIAGSLLLNFVLFFSYGPFVAGWAVLIEFLLVLVFALQSYPLFPGGLLAIQVLFLKMAPIDGVMRETLNNINVLMMLMFLIPAIYFMNPLLVWIFMRLFAATKDKVVLSLVFLLTGAFLAAWLDALTVVAVMITVAVAMKDIHARIGILPGEDDGEFDGFLRNLIMHGAVGTALGGIATLIGAPQNILIGHYAGFGFQDFYMKMAHFSIPLQLTGLVLCWMLERFRVKVFGFGYQLPERAAIQMEMHVRQNVLKQEDPAHKTRLFVMAGMFVCLMLALGFQLAPVGIVGLGLLIVLPLVTGQTDEHHLARSFEESMPFAALLVVFFVIVAMIEFLGLFTPIMAQALQLQGNAQLQAYFFASGILSSVSDNVFVASIFIHQAHNAFVQGVVDRVQFDKLSIVINAGTNIFSILTPNGQAAFLFLLTSAIARKIGLSYVRMFLMSLPYAVVLITVCFLMIG